MKTMKFLRRGSIRHSKLGKKRKKKQVWRNPTGRHNKMRGKRKGYPAVVSIGYRKKKNERGKILDKIPILVNNLRDLEKVTGKDIVLIGRVGKKRKIDIMKKAKEMNLEIHKLNPKKFLKERK